ncbi:MAG: hypothetical protein ACJAT2_003050 [Bacteriovoracaceae bacterium]
MKDSNGFSILEVIMSIGFLAALILVCTNIFNKQQTEMINAIQEIEITSTVNEIRMALKGREACTASFENKKVGSRDIKVIKKVIQYPETNEIEEVEAFPLYQYGRISFGDYQLKISSYTLEGFSKGASASKETELNLVIEFNKNLPGDEEKSLTQRKIKLYAAMDNLGRIESCSLTKEAQSDEKFMVESDELIRLKGRIGIGSKNIPSRLSLEKGIQFLASDSSVCEEGSDGIIFFHKGYQSLVICYEKEAYKISNVGLRL